MRRSKCLRCDHVGVTRYPAAYVCSACLDEARARHADEKAAKLEREARELRDEADRRRALAAAQRAKWGNK